MHLGLVELDSVQLCNNVGVAGAARIHSRKATGVNNVNMQNASVVLNLANTLVYLV